MLDESSYCSYVGCHCIIPRQVKDWVCRFDCEHHPDYFDIDSLHSDIDFDSFISMEVSDVNN